MEAQPLTAAERVAQLIKTLDISSYQFGKETGLSHQTISNVLTGKNRPSLDTLEAIAARYPDTAIWLLTGTGAPRTGHAPASVAHGRTHGEARTAVQAPEPAAPMAINRLSPEEVAVMQTELVATRRELATANQTIERLWGQNTELLKKPEASADAATDLRDEADDIMQQHYAEQDAKQYRIAAQANYGAIMGRWVSLVPAA